MIQKILCFIYQVQIDGMVQWSHVVLIPNVHHHAVLEEEEAHVASARKADG